MGSSSIITVVLFDPVHGSASGPTVHTAGLHAYGFDIQVCAEQAQLADFVANESGVCFILNGTIAQGCAAATYLRAHSPTVGILALVPCIDEAALISLLHSGVDAYCPATASVALLVASLAAISRRRAPVQSRALVSAAVPAPQTGVASQQWALADRAWVLVGAAGARIPLTTGERAFLGALFNAPGRRASHAQLTAALDHAYGEPEGSQLRTRLGILVTRLRRKCQDHHEPLPIKSVHGWGYMFAG